MCEPSGGGGGSSETQRDQPGPADSCFFLVVVFKQDYYHTVQSTEEMAKPRVTHMGCKQEGMHTRAHSLLAADNTKYKKKKYADKREF